MSKIDISIIIPVYNRAELISETLESVIAQTFQNWECIVIDDNSMDNTYAVVNKYCSIDARINIHKNKFGERKEVGFLRNLGLIEAKGRFIKFLDSDDLISPNLLKSQFDLLHNDDRDYNVATCKFGYFSNCNELGAPRLEKTCKSYSSGYKLLEDFGTYNLYLPLHVYLIPRKLIQVSGVWNSFLKINQDGEFMTRILLNTATIAFSSHGCAYYRQGLQNDRVSSLNSEVKEHHLILSWILIDNQIKLFLNSSESSIYVESARKIVLQKLTTKRLINEYGNFLKTRNHGFMTSLIDIVRRFVYLIKFQSMITGIYFLL